MQLEHDAADLHVIARLEARLLEGPHDTDALERPLHVRQRLVVLQVVARDQAVDAAADDAEGPVIDAFDAEPPLGRGAEGHVVGEIVDLFCHRRLRRHAREQLAEERVEPLPRRARRHQHRHLLAGAAGPRLPRGRSVLRRHEVGLRQRQHPRQPRERRVVRLQLALDRAPVRLRVGPVHRRELEHVHEQPRALDVREELVAQPGAPGRALDQPGDVGEHELALVALHDAEHRLERRERIVGHLRVGARQPAQQRRLARVGQPDQPDVGQQLQPHLEPALLPRHALLGEARRLARRVGELLVAPPARTAARDDHALARPHEVVHVPVVLRAPHRPWRHADFERLARRAVAQRPLPVPAAPRPVVRLALEGLQVAQRRIADEHDVAAAPTVAAVRAASGHVRLAAEAHGAIPATAGLHEDPRLVVQHRPRNLGAAPMPADPVMLITGASTGIGAATARRAVEAGYRVALAARSADKLEQLAGELGGDERAIAVPTDVTDFGQQEALVEQTRQAFGRLDVAFANAGFGAKRGFLEETPEHWRDMVLTNVLGAAYTIRAALPALKDTEGHLILTSSVAGRRPLPGSLYSATKHAVTAMAGCLRLEADGAIRVTCIEPGMTDTPFFSNRPQNALQDDDIARAVLYAVQQPPHVDVNEMLIRPTAQAG